MTIDEIYRFVQFSANKEHRGFVKPSEFNLLADRAQMEIFTQRYNNLKQYLNVQTKTAYQTTTPGIQYASNQKVLDDLRAFINHNIDLTYDVTNRVFDYPADYIHLTSLSHAGRNIKMVNEDKLYSILNSSITPPTSAKPVAVMYNEGIRVYISSAENGILISGVKCSYLRRPTRPRWAYVELDNNPLYDPSNSTQLDLPEQTHNELAMKMLTYIGINLKDNDIYAFGELQQKSGV